MVVVLKDTRSICANCGERESIVATGIIGIPFGCNECGWWGNTPETIENPPPAQYEPEYYQDYPQRPE